MNQLPQGITLEQVEALKIKHGDVFLIVLPDLDFETAAIFCKPTQATYGHFRAAFGSHKKEVSDQALFKFVKRHLLHPDPATYDSLLEKYPALCDQQGERLLRLIGIGGEVQILQFGGNP
jgi:hypothetical protein